MNKSYSALRSLKTFEERFDYLRTGSIVGEDTFGFDRYLNQKLYNSKEWKRVRDFVIIRDEGCDLGIFDRQIFDRIVIHHINPISADDVINNDKKVFDPDNLICVSERTHRAIHFGNSDMLIPSLFDERTPYDTTPWKHRQGR